MTTTPATVYRVEYFGRLQVWQPVKEQDDDAHTILRDLSVASA